ncbi:MAG TPA: hypothetical protein VHE32_05555, partial [Rhodanobacteraceae bacterium]|nr:hypothetical protein [Rhodanobacteraceae bacterium]
MRHAILSALVLAAYAGFAQAGSFYPVVQNGGIAGLSHNGRIAIGVTATGLNGAPSWRWTTKTGVEDIPDFLDAMGVSTWAQPAAGA